MTPDAADSPPLEGTEITGGFSMDATNLSMPFTPRARSSPHFCTIWLTVLPIVAAAPPLPPPPVFGFLTGKEGFDGGIGLELSFVAVDDDDESVTEVLLVLSSVPEDDEGRIKVGNRRKLSRFLT